jgi:1,2-phenylacetyl-CoA epoxidase PaaB subunit
MAKKPAETRWEVYRTRGAKRDFLGTVQAKDEPAALRAAYEKHQVREAEQFRISVVRKGE